MGGESEGGRARLRDVQAFLRSLVAPKPPEPSYPVLPTVGKRGESSVPGVFLAGEVAGSPLLRLGINAGHAWVESVAAELRAEREAAKSGDTEEEVHDLVIVGAGAAGLAAAVRAKEL